ncbi:hypothetical protein ACSTS3_03960 [Aquimarina muelleri]|uniref:hypothetical protein n=1 Tax=Aquimarina muelleri TaxID=279356 RepID=UPI003F6877FD
MIFSFSYLLFELIASISGSLYIAKYREDKTSRYFVCFLWFIFFTELFGTIPSLAYHADYEGLFSCVKGTFLEKSQLWLYNIQIIFSFAFYVYYFGLNYKTPRFRFNMNVLVLIYVLGAIINLIFSDVYFVRISSFSYTIGTILLFISGILYLYETLQSDEILSFYKIIPFYIAIGAIIFHLCVTPLFIYSKYYKSAKSPEFVQVYQIILTVANIFMYTCYTIGFIVCSRKNRSY